MRPFNKFLVARLSSDAILEYPDRGDACNNDLLWLLLHGGIVPFNKSAVFWEICNGDGLGDID